MPIDVLNSNRNLLNLFYHPINNITKIIALSFHILNCESTNDEFFSITIKLNALTLKIEISLINFQHTRF